MTEHGPWNPGIVSPVPAELVHLCTIFRAENVYTSFAEARELRGLTGLDYSELVAFRPERLALHELLIRVSADLSVPDGEKIEDLGINFRAIVSDLLARSIAPRQAAIASRYAELKNAIAALAARAAATLFVAKSPAPVADVQRAALEAKDPLERAAHQALAKLVAAVLARHGRMWGTPDLLGAIATTLACNAYASEEIGRLIAPWIEEAVAAGAYRRLPDQPQPVVMNTKGASASGKSTIRPLQRQLAGRIGTRWADFALISPDIWRKQLLDYGSLGDAYKYAGAFTGDELHVVDQKLDQYMARKAEGGRMSHLLIDRFRFDSFAPDSDVAGSNLLTRFGRIVYLFFMITPPADLVERAWRRGLDVGRYKAVDDTLAHGVEAYSGMPDLFFTWVARSDKRVHFEFLDNTVSLGERPRTIAFGWNDTLTVLDVKCMLDVVRYRRIDINARSPDELFREPTLLVPEKNTAFLRDCVARFREVNFAEQASGRIYVQLERGRVNWYDADVIARAGHDAETRGGLQAVAPQIFGGTPARGAPPKTDALLESARPHTVGQWGPSLSSL